MRNRLVPSSCPNSACASCTWANCPHTYPNTHKMTPSDRKSQIQSLNLITYLHRRNGVVGKLLGKSVTSRDEKNYVPTEILPPWLKSCPHRLKSCPPLVSLSNPPPLHTHRSLSYHHHHLHSLHLQNFRRFRSDFSRHSFFFATLLSSWSFTGAGTKARYMAHLT